MKAMFRMIMAFAFLSASAAYADLAGEHGTCHKAGALKGQNVCSACDTMSQELAD